MMKLVLLIGDSKCDCPQKVAFIFSACNVRPTTGGRKKGLQILLSYSQAGPDSKAKQGQEEISRNHVPTFFLFSVDDIGCAEDRHNFLRQIMNPSMTRTRSGNMFLS